VVAVSVYASVIEAYAGAEDDVVVDGKMVRQKYAELQQLKIWQYKAPASTAVVLIFCVDSSFERVCADCLLDVGRG